MTERQLQTKVNEYLRSRGGYYMKLSDRFNSGYPDTLYFEGNRAYALELKVGKNKPSRLQQYVLLKLASCGVITGVCYNLQEVKNIIERR